MKPISGSQLARDMAVLLEQQASTQRAWTELLLKRPRPGTPEYMSELGRLAAELDLLATTSYNAHIDVLERLQELRDAARPREEAQA